MKNEQPRSCLTELADLKIEAMISRHALSALESELRVREMIIKGLERLLYGSGVVLAVSIAVNVVQYVNSR